jgi:Holliday junction resolvase RusA-like endonuclease
MDNYAKVVILGSPISKSNFKLFNLNGRAILPNKSGKYHDRYAVYEEQIALEARSQNPNLIFDESLIAVLKVYYKSSKRHPDTNNITKSIFDGIEKSGLIVNDAQIRRLIIEEFYDRENPRFELELFCESSYEMKYSICHKEVKDKPLLYNLPCNRQVSVKKLLEKMKPKEGCTICSVCGKNIKKEDSITVSGGKSFICRDCLRKSF